MSAAAPAGEPRRVLGLRDLVLFNVAAVVSPRWMAAAAHAGAGSLGLWCLAALLFFVPCAICVSALSRRYPEQGGFYVWIRESHGEWPAFLSAWLYFLNNLFWIPNVILATAGMVAASFPGARFYAEESRVMLPLALGLLGAVITANYVGMRVVKWIDTLGGFGVYAIWMLMVGAAVGVYALRGPATEFRWIPTLDWAKVNFWSQLAFGMTGLELSPILSGEVRDPARTVFRATWISAFFVVLAYAGGTAALLTLLPPGEMSPVVGLTQGARQAAMEMGWRWAPFLVGLCVLISLAGQLGTYVGASARLPFVLGIGHLLPPGFARLHPRYGTPSLSIAVLGVGGASLLVLSQFGESFRAAYQKMVDMSVITMFIPFLFLFASAWRNGLRWPATAGAIVSALAIGLSFVPTADVRSVPLFEAELLGCTALLIVIARVLYVRYRPAA